MPVAAGERNGVDGLRLASASDQEVVKERAQWWNWSLKVKWGAINCSLLEGVEAVRLARAADQCNTSAGRGLSPVEGREHAALARAAGARELDDLGKFDAFSDAAVDRR